MLAIGEGFESKALEAVMKSCAQPKGRVQSLKAMDTQWDTEWGYLQVSADSPQDIIDAVTRDEGYKDVLQEKETSCWERFSPSPVQFFTGRDRQRRHALESPYFQELHLPHRHFPEEFPCCYFCSLLKPGPDFFGASLAQLLLLQLSHAQTQRDTAANGARTHGKPPQGWKGHRATLTMLDT